MEPTKDVCNTFEKFLSHEAEYVGMSNGTSVAILCNKLFCLNGIITVTNRPCKFV